MFGAEHGAGAQLADHDYPGADVGALGPVADVLGHLFFTAVDNDSERD